MELGVPAPSPAPKSLCLTRHSRAFSGILVVMVTGATWAGFTELVKTADQPRNSSSLSGDPADQSDSMLKGAAGLTYFFTAWLVLAFPPYLTVNVLLRHRPIKSVLGYVLPPPPCQFSSVPLGLLLAVSMRFFTMPSALLFCAF